MRHCFRRRLCFVALIRSVVEFCVKCLGALCQAILNFVSTFSSEVIKMRKKKAAEQRRAEKAAAKLAKAEANVRNGHIGHVREGHYWLCGNFTNFLFTLFMCALLLAPATGREGSCARGMVDPCVLLTRHAAGSHRRCISRRAHWRDCSSFRNLAALLILARWTTCLATA